MLMVSPMPPNVSDSQTIADGLMNDDKGKIIDQSKRDPCCLVHSLCADQLCLVEDGVNPLGVCAATTADNAQR